jgi:succinyl-CoA synthetase alpha subunit
MFLADPKPESIVMIGEIGGSAEEDAAQFLKDEGCAAAGSRWSGSSLAAPRHPAGAWASAGQSFPAAKVTPSPKIAAMESAGIKVSPSPARIGKRWSEVLKL